ncbi:MAG: hypothetical protein M3Y24_05080 [Acidobacteriota bacterium]|nr:hypothetical protein [Acidobacteriota bacterium]
MAASAAEHGTSIHMPRIGSGLAGGSWEEVEEIIKRTLARNGLEITVYDYDGKLLSSH